LKSRYPDFDSHVSTLKELLYNCNRELAVQSIENFQHPKLRKEGFDFLNP